MTEFQSINNSLSILAAADRAPDRRLLKSWLTGRGYTVPEAEDGTETWRKAGSW